VEADPNRDECYYHLAIAHLWTDKEQEALVNFTKAIEFRPDQISYYTRLDSTSDSVTTRRRRRC
jgi:hypothetical protein